MKNFYNELMEKVEEHATDEGQSKISSFIALAIQMIAEREDLDWDDWKEAYFTPSPRPGVKTLRVDAYCYDDNEQEELTLFVCDFQDDPDPEKIGRMTKSDVEKSLRQLRQFYEAAVEGKMKPGMGTTVEDLVRLIAGKTERPFDRRKGVLHLVLLTNKEIDPAETIDLDREEGDGLKIKCRFYDLNRLRNPAREPIVLELADESRPGLPFLKMSKDESIDFFDSYLFVLPGETLATFYEKYRTRVLEGNVRAYLQQRGKVNKGMATTLRQNPYVFFIYNNGLTVTADHVEFSEDGKYISRIQGAQVVNGGQTMATIHDLWKDKTDIHNVSVQVKLTVVQEIVSQILVPNISKYSNSQNAVKEADLSSNEIVQRAIETLSRQCVTPRQNYWFYERIRGQYKSQLEQRSAKQKKVFQNSYPKDQVITPYDFAKTFLTFEMRPWLVCRGAAKAYSKDSKSFRDEMNRVWTDKADVIRTSTWYKTCVAKRIIVRDTKKEVKNIILTVNDAFKSFLAGFQAYSIALLVAVLKEQSSSIDFMRLWNDQATSRGLVRGIGICAKEILEYVTKYHPQGHSEWMKKEDSWTQIMNSLAPRLKGEIAAQQLGKAVVPYPPSLLFDFRTYKSYVQRRVCQELDETFWTSLLNWIGEPSSSLKSMHKLICARLEGKRTMTKKECKDLQAFAEQQELRGWIPPDGGNTRIINETPCFKSIAGDPVEILCGWGEVYDMLALERTCDRRGGSRYLDRLFALFPELREREASKERSLGDVAIYSVTLPSGKERRVAFLYTRRSEKSVSFADIFRRTLETLHGQASADSDRACRILLPREGGLPAKEWQSIVEAELFSEVACMVEAAP